MAESESTPSLSRLEVVRQVLQDGGLHPQEFDDEFSCGFVVDLADELYYGAIAHLVKGAPKFVFYVDFRQGSTQQTQSQVTEFITRLNHGMHVGNFELDYGDGNVRFRSGVDYAGTELTYELVRNAMLVARDSVEGYGKGLEKVLSGVMTAREAIAEIEKGATE